MTAPNSGITRFEVPVTAEVAYSIAVGEKGWIKPGARVEFISTGDPEEEAAQIEQAMNAISMAYRRIDEVLLVLTSEAIADKPSIADVLDAQQHENEIMKENIKRMADEIRRQGRLLKAAGIDPNKG